MRLTEKSLSQLFIIGFPGFEIPGDIHFREVLAAGNLGGVILFNRCLHDPRLAGNIESPQQLKRLTTSLQALSSTPLLIGVDQEGGAVKRLLPENGFPDTPSAREMARKADHTDFTGTVADRTARALAAVGVNLNFAPVVDLNSNPKNPVIGAIGRSFSADPLVVSNHAAAWIQAHRHHGVLCCLKHFPGHGSSARDSHHGFVDISASWQDMELIPYRTLIAGGEADMVMTGHLYNRLIDPDFPATLSTATVNGLLRDRLGFTGIIVSDDLQMKAISEHYPFAEAICRTLAAGVDMVIIGNNLAYNPDVIEEGITAVSSGLLKGLVKEERLLNALERVKNIKRILKRLS